MRYQEPREMRPALLVESAAPQNRREAGETLDRTDCSNTDTTMLTAALAAAAAGWSVFPCRPRDQPPIRGRERKSKSPLTRHGHLEATVDPWLIKEWWRRHADAMIGTRVPEGLMVVDIDPRNGGSRRAIETACKAAIPPTLTVWSGRGDGGCHLYFRRPVGQLSSRLLPTGVDLKTSGGYVIIPPSVHPASGHPYTWDLHPVAELPTALRELLRPPTQRSRATGFQTSVTTGERSVALLRKLGQATVGERNSLLFWTACRAAE